MSYPGKFHISCDTRSIGKLPLARELNLVKFWLRKHIVPMPLACFQFQ